jgi:hypothetical protein
MDRARPGRSHDPHAYRGLLKDRSLAPTMLLDTDFGVIYWYECIRDIGSSVFEQAGDAYGWLDDGLITED